MLNSQSVLRVISYGLLACSAMAVQAQAPASAVGYVKTVSGDAWISTTGQKVKAVPGTPVKLGSQLKTAPSASLGVTFIDNTIMSFGPDTELTVDEYIYSPAKGDLKFGSSMTKGSLNYVSGVIAKLKPDGVTVKTPTGIIGVRGTHFVVKVEEQ